VIFYPALCGAFGDSGLSKDCLRVLHLKNCLCFFKEVLSCVNFFFSSAKDFQMIPCTIP